MDIRLSDSLLFGIDVLDKQHLGLIDHLNELRKLVDQNDKSEIRKRLKKFKVLLEKHFHDEEFYMKSTGYDGLDAHIGHHNTLLLKTNNIIFQIEDSNQLTYEDVYKSVDLIVVHLIKEDVEFHTYLFQIGYNDKLHLKVKN